MSARLDTQTFVECAKAIHEDKYDYSLTEYKGSKEKVIIICPIHGEFYQCPEKHLKSRGCYTCGIIKKSNNQTQTKEDFIGKAKAVHKNKYDYSLVDYKKSDEKITIICPEHGSFQQTPSSHIQGSGCNKCFTDRIALTQKLSKEDFIGKAKNLHEDKYDYSLVNYKNSKTKVTIICHEHGEFYQTPTTHLRGSGCRKCSSINGGQKNRKSLYSFLSKANEIYDNFYDYSKVVYKTRSSKVTITCPKHGDFIKTPHRHLLGQGCPKCFSNRSKQENELFKYIQSIYNGVIITSDRTIIPPYELDIVLPDEKLAIEYCGLYWHSDEKLYDKDYHKIKLDLAHNNEYRLITIFEDEWTKNQHIIQQIVKTIIDECDTNYAYSFKNNDIYCDRRWSEGHGLEHEGYEYAYTLPPSFYYTNNKARFTEEEVKQHSLDTSKLSKIWNCGYNVYSYFT